MIHSETDRRLFAAIEFVDAFTGARVREPLRLRCDDARLVRQDAGRWLVLGLGPRLPEALRAHADSFDDVPPLPPTASEQITVRVHDPAHRYRATEIAVALPRSGGPPAAADSVMRPQTVTLWPTAAAPMQPNWTVVHAQAVAADGRTPLAGARVSLQAGATVLASLTDALGQAVLVLVGQPIFSLDGGGQLRRSLAVTLRLQHDPDPANALADTAAELARLAARPLLRELQRQLPTGEPSSVKLAAP